MSGLPAKKNSEKCTCPLSKFSAHRKSKCTFQGAKSRLSTISSAVLREDTFPKAPRVEDTVPAANSASIAASREELAEDTSLMDSFDMIEDDECSNDRLERASESSDDTGIQSNCAIFVDSLTRVLSISGQLPSPTN